jgi:hypothetical protein
MTKAEAARRAHHIVAKLIESYFDTHDPEEDIYGETTEKDRAKLEAALNHIMATHYRKAGRQFDAGASLTRLVARRIR